MTTGRPSPPPWWNNYIKDGLVPRAAGKRYGPIHLGYLTAVCALKKVLSVRDIGILLRAAEERNKTPEELYQYFCGALDQALSDTAAAIDADAGREDLAPHGPGPGPAQLRRPAGLRPHSGYSPALGGGTPQESQKINADQQEVVSMSEFVLMTDSSADLSQEMVQELGVDGPASELYHSGKSLPKLSG